MAITIPDKFKSRKFWLTVSGLIGLFFTAISDGNIDGTEFAALVAGVTGLIGFYNHTEGKIDQVSIQTVPEVKR